MSLWNNRFSQKTNEKISKISALASKERSNQKNKGILLYYSLIQYKGYNYKF